MTSDKKNHSIEELIKKVSTYLSDPNDLQDIRKAYEYANDAHKDQIRKNGDPYITHPLNVAFILTGIRSDKETIMAALLHETVDEASVGKEEIEKVVPEKQQAEHGHGKGEHGNDRRGNGGMFGLFIVFGAVFGDEARNGEGQPGGRHGRQHREYRQRHLIHAHPFRAEGAREDDAV